jgi:hypothetical protein
LPAPEFMVSSLLAPMFETMVLAAALPLIVSSVVLPTYTPSMALFDQFTLAVRAPFFTSGALALEVRLMVSSVLRNWLVEPNCAKLPVSGSLSELVVSVMVSLPQSLMPNL